jgi:hypothetical protein
VAGSAAAVVVEPPVLVVVDLEHLPVLALAQLLERRAHRVPLPRLVRLVRLLLLPLAKAHLPVLALAPGPEPVVVVLAVLVVEAAAVLLPHLLSRQSFSAAMARSSPSPAPPTYEPAPKSR